MQFRKKANAMTAFLVGVLIFITGHMVFSAPHFGDPYTLTQPDGTRIEVKIWGDEYYRRVISPDGYTLIPDPDTGWVNYAVLNRDGSAFVPSGIIYTGEPLRQKAAVAAGIPKDLQLIPEAIAAIRTETLEALGGPFDTIDTRAVGPVEGKITGLTILIDFPDEPATIPREVIDRFCNEPGFSDYGNNGSVKDYFSDISNGKLEYTNVVTAYYRTTYAKSFYDNCAMGQAQFLLREALDGLDAANFDFSQVTRNSYNIITAVNVVYAGKCGCPWAQGLWPHRGQLIPAFESKTGVKVSGYQMVDSGDSITLAAFAHENGHLICNFDDLYDKNGGSKGIGSYGLMCWFGSYTNPLPPNAHFRNLVGWESVTELTTSMTGKLLGIDSNTNTSYIYRNPASSKESYYIEARQKKGRSAALPDEGLIFWHVDEWGNNNNEQMTSSSHYYVSLEQADGLFDLEKDINNGDANDLFDASGVSTFNDSTVPNANWWKDGNSGLNITNISHVGDRMTFSFGQLSGPTPTPTATVMPTATITPTPTMTPEPTAYYVNIAVGKTVRASTEFGPEFTASLAVDGNEATAWGAAVENKPQWIYIDLGKKMPIDGLGFTWFAPYFAAEYQIYVSNDLQNWTYVVTVKNGDTKLYGSAEIRYIGVYCTKKNQLTYALAEFEVYQKKLDVPTPTATPTATVTPTPSGTPTVPAWVPGKSYTQGDLVSYQGSTWECTADHVSQTNWYPGASGVYLWRKVTI